MVEKQPTAIELPLTTIDITDLLFCINAGIKEVLYKIHNGDNIIINEDSDNWKHLDNLRRLRKSLN